ncbi:hypothetical protein [Knoellia locipacati]
MSQPTPAPDVATADRPVDAGMRRSRRVVLVALTGLAFLAAL